MQAGAVLALCGALVAAAATGCARAPEARSGEPAIHRDGYDPATLDLARPCTLLRPIDASRLFQQPFYRTIAADRVSEDRIRCGQGVGEGGLMGLAEVDVLSLASGESAAARFQAVCDPRARGLAVGRPPPGVRTCRATEGGVALLGSDVVLIVRGRGGDGAVAPARSEAAAALVAGRLAPAAAR